MFQSTRPAWGATGSAEVKLRGGMVSIHAPRVGRDEIKIVLGGKFSRFNPRAPRGARLNRFGQGDKRNGFQSTRPAWGATGLC